MEDVSYTRCCQKDEINWNWNWKLSRNAVNGVVREEQNLHKVHVILLKPSTLPNWGWSTACGSRYGPLTTPPVTVLNIRVDAPAHLWSALTAHHTVLNQPHILQKLDANVIITKQELYKQFIWKTIGAQCRRSYVVDGTFGFGEIRCSYVTIIDINLVSVIVPLYFQYLS
jgi:hypothetical protein